MSRSKGNRRTSKATGRNVDFWSRRPMSNSHGCIPGRRNKTWTHRLERRHADRDLRNDEAA